MLRLDLVDFPHQGFDGSHALDQLAVIWFEEPVSSDDLAGPRRVREECRADATFGEYGYSLDYFARMADAGAVDCLQVDVTRCGGISELLRIAPLAAAHHLDISGHCAPYQHLAVLAAVPNLRHLEWFHDHVRIEQLFFDGADPPRDGARHDGVPSTIPEPRGVGSRRIDQLQRVAGLQLCRTGDRQSFRAKIEDADPDCPGGRLDPGIVRAARRGVTRVLAGRCGYRLGKARPVAVARRRRRSG